MPSNSENDPVIHFPRPLLASAAVLYASVCLVYCVIWLYAVYSTPKMPGVELGFATDFSPGRYQLVKGVDPASPAEKAGLLPGDHIVALDGHEIQTPAYLSSVWSLHKPGDTISLSVRRPGKESELQLKGVFRARQSPSNETGFQYFSDQVRDLFPVPFLLIGLTVLFLRLESPSVWLLALMLCSTAATPGMPNGDLIPFLWRPVYLTFKVVSVSLLGPFFYCFFAIFPRRSPIDRRLPWLKGGSVVLGLTIFLVGENIGVLTFFSPMQLIFGAEVGKNVTFVYTVGFIVFGWLSLVLNYLRTAESDSRRKIRFIFWGTLIGWAPSVVRVAAENFLGYQTPDWIITVCVLVLLLFPLSFAYAVVRHRILEIPVLLKRSARYLLVQRGFTIILFLVTVGLTVVLALSVSGQLQATTQAAQPVGFTLGAFFGGALLLGGLRVHQRVSGRIDRAFFRTSYDARLILEDLAERASSATGRAELAQLLELHLRRALQPSSITLYLRESKDHLVLAAGTVPPEWKSISSTLPRLVELAQRGKPVEIPRTGEDGMPADSVLRVLQAECAVPLVGRGGLLVGVIVLGSRLSEEPYSGEDKRLLASVARQAATSFENIRLAEEIAVRMESERRVSLEFEIAKNVQSRLLPAAPKNLKTLECAARCIQAKAVGGDYYDFLDLGDGRLGLVLADVSGKGIHAALLMANLQAHIRSQSGTSPDRPAQMLREVNQILWKSTAPEHFATLFYGVYDDHTRSLSYVNCGHNPPVVIHHGKTVKRLAPTATVIGAFEKWTCTVATLRLHPDDMLVVFSDGVTEAFQGDAQFGDERLIELLLNCSKLPVDAVADAVLKGVQEFSAGQQSDDLTLLVARVHAARRGAA